MEYSTIIVGILIFIASGIFLLHGFRFGSIYLFTRGSSSGMKDRKNQPVWFWAAVVEWSIFLLSGLFLLAIGVSPSLLAWVRA